MEYTQHQHAAEQVQARAEGEVELWCICSKGLSWPHAELSTRGDSVDLPHMEVRVPSTRAGFDLK